MAEGLQFAKSPRNRLLLNRGPLLYKHVRPIRHLIHYRRLHPTLLQTPPSPIKLSATKMQRPNLVSLHGRYYRDTEGDIRWSCLHCKFSFPSCIVCRTRLPFLPPSFHPASPQWFVVFIPWCNARRSIPPPAPYTKLHSLKLLITHLYFATLLRWRYHHPSSHRE
jgi:hypothetical protein